MRRICILFLLCGFLMIGFFDLKICAQDEPPVVAEKEFEFPGFGMTTLTVRADPGQGFELLFGSDNRIAMINNNQTDIDPKGMTIGARMQASDGESIIDVAYIARGVTKDIAQRAIAGQVISEEIDSNTIIQRTLPDGTKIKLISNASSGENISARSKGNLSPDQSTTFAKMTMKVTGTKILKVLEGANITKLLVATGKASIRLENVVLNINGDSIFVPLVVFVFDFKNCPTVICKEEAEEDQCVVGNFLDENGVVVEEVARKK